ncbi:MFS transporter [Prauserella flavalba]|uniref:MFS transporter n=1 Tax=Prauserella flavalba TaxID=1477506 RepID=UPI0036E05AB1
MGLLELDATAIYVALPQLSRMLDGSFEQLQWVVNAYALTLATLVLLFGALADRFGHRRFLLAGIALFVAASAGATAAPSVESLIAFRVGQGFGGAMIFAVTPAILAGEYGSKVRGVAFGVFTSVSGLAVAIGPLVGGLLVDFAGWRSIFLINVPVGLLLLFVVLVKTKESPGAAKRRFDWFGGASVAASVGLLTFLVLVGFSSPRMVPFVGAALLVFAVAAVFRRWIPKRTVRVDKNPILRKSSFYGLSLVALLGSAALSATMFLLVSYLQNVRGYAPALAGAQLLPWTIVIAASSLAFGRVAGGHRPGHTLAFSLLMLSGGVLAGLAMSPTATWLTLLPMMVISGMGVGLLQPARMTAATSMVSRDSLGEASGLNQTSYLLGTVVGVAVVGYFFRELVSNDIRGSWLSVRYPEQLPDLANAVASGRLEPPSYVLRDGFGGQFTDTVEVAFADAFRGAVSLAAGMALLGAVLALALIRNPGARVES